MKKSTILILIFLSLFSLVHGIELTGLLNSHDPATITKDGTKYWHFTTGVGVWSSYSTNLSHWIGGPGPVFASGTWPSWINSYVPGFAGSFWAPDVIFMNGEYYLYYSCSTWGSSRSAIGLVRTTSLNTPVWVDEGMVVYSDGSSTAINAIDPGIFRDTDGKAYMVYGSWFGGIGIVEIDTVSGKATSSTTHLYGGSHQDIEASYMIKEGEYYYLVVNRGNCCQDVNSTYYITVGRSTNIFGPYEGWRTILSTDGKYIGPGHFGLLRKSCANYVSIHYYDGNAGGASKLDILEMTFVDGWPSLTRDFSFSDCTTGTFEIAAREDDEIELYPNPSINGRFTIHFLRPLMDESISVSIYTLGAKQLFNQEYEKSNAISIDCGLKQGVYLVRVICGREVYYKKLSIR